MNNENNINELKALRGDVYQERENLLAAIQQGQKQVSEFNIKIGELNAKIQEALDSYVDGQIKEDLTKSMDLVEDDILEEAENKSKLKMQIFNEDTGEVNNLELREDDILEMPKAKKIKDVK